MQTTLITILAALAIAHAQTTGVDIVTPPLDKYTYLNPTTSVKTVFSDGVLAKDSYTNSPIACNGNWMKSDVQIYKKGTCYNIPPVATGATVTSQANSICNFAYTITNLQTSFSSPNPTFVSPAGATTTNFAAYNYLNLPTAGCSYQILLDVSACGQALYLPYYGQGCQTTVGNIQYQTTLIGSSVIPTASTTFATWYGLGTAATSYPSAAYSTAGYTDCSLANTANINKLTSVPSVSSASSTTSQSQGTATKYQCGAPKNLYTTGTGIPTCKNGVSTRCLYSINDIYTSTPYNLLVMSAWNNNGGSGCTGNMTEAQVVSTGTCFSATTLSVGNAAVKINGDKLTKPYVKATIGSNGQTYNLNYYHTETNCLANSNAVETFVGSLNTCLTEDDHPSDDAVSKPNVVYSPNNVVGQTNRIQVNFYPSSYTCNSNNDDDNYCTITSGGIAGIVIAVVFVVFLLLVILFMCIRYCGKAPPSSGAAPTVTQSKGGEGNPLLAGQV